MGTAAIPPVQRAMAAEAGATLPFTSVHMAKRQRRPERSPMAAPGRVAFLEGVQLEDTAAAAAAATMAAAGAAALPAVPAVPGMPALPPEMAAAAAIRM